MKKKISSILGIWICILSLISCGPMPHEKQHKKQAYKKVKQLTSGSCYYKNDNGTYMVYLISDDDITNIRARTASEIVNGTWIEVNEEVFQNRYQSQVDETLPELEVGIDETGQPEMTFQSK